MVDDEVLEGSEDSLEVDAEMMVVTLVLSVDESLPEYRVNILILNGCSVLAEVFSYQYAVRTIQLGGLRGLGVHDGIDAW